MSLAGARVEVPTTRPISAFNPAPPLIDASLGGIAGRRSRGAGLGVAQALRGTYLRLHSLVKPLSVWDFRLLWLAQCTSELGDWATRLALSLAVYDRTRSAALSAAVVTVSLIPWAGPGQVVTSWLERFGRREVMVITDLVRALVFLAMVVAKLPIAALFSGAFVAGLASVPFEAARYSIRVEVSDDNELYSGAITLFGITTQLATIFGFAIGGVLVALVGARVAFGINACSFAISALLISFVRTSGTAGTGGTGRSNRGLKGGSNRGLKGGSSRLVVAVRSLLDDPVLRWCSALSLSTAFAGMAVEAIAAVFGRGRPGEVAFLALSLPIGLVVAGIVVPHSGSPNRLLRIAGLVPLIGGSAGALLFAVSGQLVVSALAFGVAGLAVGVTIPAGPVVGRRMPADIRASAFAVLQGAALGGQAAGAMAGGLIAGVFGARATCVAACAALALLGLAASARVPMVSERSIME